MVWLCTVGVIFLAIGGYFGWIQWRLIKKVGVGTVLAKLTDWKYEENAEVREGRSRIKKVKHLTHYEYTYSVGGKDYRVKGFATKSPRDIPKMATAVYINNAPYHGQIPGHTMDLSMTIALLGIGAGALFVLIGLLLLFV